MAALLLIVAGVTLFAVARHALASIAKGTYAVPQGTSWLARADHHAAQSTIALWIIAAGMVVGIGSAIRHARRSRG